MKDGKRGLCVRSVVLLAILALAAPAQAGPDCNGNGVPDDQDIAGGTSADCNGNGVPDECDIANGAEDLDGNGVPDSCERIYVDRDAPLGGDGKSWATAYTRLQTALAVSASGLKVQIWVAEGTYTPTEPGGDRNLSFEVPDGVSLFGGFAGTESSLLQQDPVAHPTLLSGDLNGNDQPNGDGRHENAYHVVRLFLPLGGQQINGFHITGGQADRGGPSPNGRSGAGIFANYGLRWTLANCLVYGNKALERGGGMYCEVISPDVVNTRFYDNAAGNVFVAGSGAGIYSRRAALRCANTVFTGNRARSYSSEAGLGGALFLDLDPRTTIANCAFAGNEATWHGAGVYVRSTAEDPGNTFVRNTILWGNTDSQGALEASQLYVSDPAAMVEVSYSCLEGLDAWMGLPGNLGADPLFVDLFGPDGRAGTADDDLRLLPASPCIDAGRNGYLPPDVADLDRDRDVLEQLPLDLAGDPRRVDDPAVPDSGAGVAPLVDIGPYERQAP